MLLGFKTQLKLNNKQRTMLAKHAGVARHAWNWGLAATKFILDHNKENPDSKFKFPSAIDLHKLLVKLVKPENSWYYEVSKSAPQFALRDLRTAWDRCFKKTSAPPKFKKKGKHDSFTIDGTIKIKGQNKIQVPIIGTVRTFEDLPQVPVKNVTISRQADYWFISFKVEIETKLNNIVDNPVGVDLGLLRFATLSDGQEFNSPRPFRVMRKKLAKLQWRNRLKEIGSKNWRKAQIKIARLHADIANIRKDFIHKVTTQLAKNHSHVVIEDLNVSGMMANGKLSKAIADSGFYEFRRQLEYKTKLYGCELVLANRWFPSSKTCSNCGHKKVSLSLSERTYNCECGFVCDRDVNAAINLVRLVKSDFKPVDKKEPSPLVESGNKQQTRFA
jgi:putative transposase